MRRRGRMHRGNMPRVDMTSLILGGDWRWGLFVAHVSYLSTFEYVEEVRSLLGESD